jgi:uncharacterized protein (TIGR02421 family)
MAPFDPALAGERRLIRLGLEIRPTYRQSPDGPLYAIEHAALHRQLARALKRIFYAHAIACTGRRPAHFLALGRRTMTPVVSECDELLAGISSEFDLLLHVSPVNSAEAWEAFRQSGYEREAEFLYRPRPISPSLMKRRLFDIPIERIEDPTLATIFAAKREELDRQITLVADRNTPRFLFGSRQLFGDVSTDLLALAKEMLGRLPPPEAAGQDAFLSPQEVAEDAQTLLDAYREQDPGLESRVELRDDIPGILVSRGNFLIGSDARVARARINATLAHEIGTHVLTHHNGKQQPFRELYAGMAGYEAFQEGLAVLSEYLVGGIDSGRLRLLAGRVMAVRSICDGADFIETFRLLRNDFGFSERVAFNITMRVYRGGGYTKDQVYLQGLVEILDYLGQGRELETLYLGKLAGDAIDFIEELVWRKVLEPVRLRPLHLATPEAQARLEHLRRHPDVMQLAGDAA